MKQKKQTRSELAEVIDRRQIERELILDILIESTKWHIDNDADDAIRLEVLERAHKLFLDDVPEARAAIPEMPMPSAPTEGRVKVQVAPGVYKRLPVFMLTQEPCRWSKTGYSWKVKPEYQAEVDAKPSEPEPDKLGDEFWSDHEKC